MTAPDAPPTGPDPTLREAAEALLDDAVAFRRDLHRHPELGLHLPRTQSKVIDALDGLPLHVTTGSEISSVVAVLEGAHPGPTTLLRADMDALPMDEDTEVDYVSEVPGAMHACGHDAHVAMLVGAARLLADRRGDLAGRVVFMFQPGEEGHDGAGAMLDEGLLTTHGPVDRAFAIHVTPLMPVGWVTARPGPMLASADSFEVTVTGEGGHASMPHDAVDPMPAACEVVLAVQSMITRQIPVGDPAVLTVASIQAGSTTNVIPEQVRMLGTIRALSEASRSRARAGLERIADHVSRAHGCTGAVHWVGEEYPVTVNDATQVHQVLDLARGLFGEHGVFELPSPVMGAEDWSRVLQKVPGCMVFLGMAPAGVAQPAPNHSNRMCLDDAGMAHGIALHAALASSPLA